MILYTQVLIVALAYFKFIDSTVVFTQYGPVLGAERTTEMGTKYFSFQGIPYARPPEGNLRFRVNFLYLI